MTLVVFMCHYLASFYPGYHPTRPNCHNALFSLCLIGVKGQTIGGFPHTQSTIATVTLSPRPICCFQFSVPSLGLLVFSLSPSSAESLLVLDRIVLLSRLGVQRR